MVYKLRMPKIDANVEHGQISRWIKSGGDEVLPGEPVVEIITDKATFEYESEEGGRLRRIYAPEKSAVPVGYVLATIGDADEAEPEDIQRENEILMTAWQKASDAGVEALPAVTTAPHDDDSKRVRATPPARRMARERGIDLADIPGALNGKRITEKDVEDYLASRGRT
ncbi:MAG TPA: E3 binding domain-containing protein [Candidatus Brocadiia bacterium]|nr:E3 binding domain-containing protein [Candidatus Brocadiia bacterium]